MVAFALLRLTHPATCPPVRLSARPPVRLPPPSPLHPVPPAVLCYVQGRVRLGNQVPHFPAGLRTGGHAEAGTQSRGLPLPIPRGGVESDPDPLRDPVARL